MEFWTVFLRFGILAVIVLAFLTAPEGPVRTGILGGMIATLIGFLLAPRQHCPHCGQRLPRFRHAVTPGDWWRGRWRCPHCKAPLSDPGASVDKR